MEDFKYYIISSRINFYCENTVVGAYEDTKKYHMEMKAIREYKDSVWNIQGLINNLICIGDNFSVSAEVVLKGVEDSEIILRKTKMEL